MHSDLALLAPAPGKTAAYGDLIGKPFKWKARGPDAFDCYGLVEEMCRRIGEEVPDYLSPTVQAEIMTLIDVQSDLWTRCEGGPGALVTFRLPVRSPTGHWVPAVVHCGFVLPHDRFIHAWDKTGGVTVERLSGWALRTHAFYRFPQTS